MLINLSNHPLNTWSKKQFKTAEQKYGKIIDIPFPEIDPYADSDFVANIADEYLKICKNMLADDKEKNNAVHLMGEHTFCFILTYKMLSKGIKVIASTTKRNSLDVNDGKLTKFEFVKFRKYIKTNSM